MSVNASPPSAFPVPILNLLTFMPFNTKIDFVMRTIADGGSVLYYLHSDHPERSRRGQRPTVVSCQNHDRVSWQRSR